MRYALPVVLVLLFVATSSAQTTPPNGGGGSGESGGGSGGSGGGSTTCPGYLLGEFNSFYFYQEVNCQTGKMLSGYKRYGSKVKTGCNGMTGCHCNDPTSTSMQAEYADPNTRIFVPFGGGASSHLGPSKQLVQAGAKKFVIISMRFKGKPTTSGANDHELNVVVQFGQEVAPTTTIPTGNTNATLTGNSLSFGGQTYTVTTMGMTPPQ